MQLFKHMEVLLMLAFGVLCATVAWTSDTHQRPPAEDVARAAATAPALGAQSAAPMPIVQIIGHRLTPEERSNRAPHAGGVMD